MQKLIAKYGLAAHLALLAVAPLFLFPFVGESQIAVVLLWLAFPAFVWIVLEPSVRPGEMLHDARRRVFWSLVTDPLMWASLVLVVFTGVRALNAGIALAYNAETAKWFVSSAEFPLLPGSVGSAGFLPFAATVALVAVLLGVRHALGLSARMAFLLVSSTLAGVAATIALFFVTRGNPVVLSLVKGGVDVVSTAGLAFALHFLGGTIALLAAFDRKWNAAMLCFVFAIGGTAAGAFAFLSVFSITVCFAAEILLLAYVFAFACRALASAGEFKYLVIMGMSLTLGGLLVVSVVPENALQAKLDAFVALDFLPESMMNARRMLSEIALKSWIGNLWIGTGLGSFSFDFRFNASAEDWGLAPSGAKACLNGWWHLLAERGLVGCVALALPFGFVTVTYVKRLIKAFPFSALPHPAVLLLLLVFGVIGATGCFDVSFLRADALIATGALVSVSASSISRAVKKKGNG